MVSAFVANTCAISPVCRTLSNSHDPLYSTKSTLLLRGSGWVWRPKKLSKVGAQGADPWSWIQNPPALNLD